MPSARLVELERIRQIEEAALLLLAAARSDSFPLDKPGIRALIARLPADDHVVLSPGPDNSPGQRAVVVTPRGDGTIHLNVMDCGGERSSALLFPSGRLDLQKPSGAVGPGENVRRERRLSRDHRAPQRNGGGKGLRQRADALASFRPEQLLRVINATGRSTRFEFHLWLALYPTGVVMRVGDRSPIPRKVGMSEGRDQRVATDVILYDEDGSRYEEIFPPQAPIPTGNHELRFFRPAITSPRRLFLRQDGETVVVDLPADERS